MQLILCVVVATGSVFVSCADKNNSITASENKISDTMKNANSYTSTFLVDQQPPEVFKAITDFRAWWSEEIEGQTDQLNAIFLYHYKEVHICKLQLIEKVADTKLVYQVLANEFSFVQDKTEWVNTKLVFEIDKIEGKTRVKFTHEGLLPNHECYAVCNDAWTGYIQGSLKNLISTGKGKPNAKEGGLNAELVEKWGLPDK